MPTQIIYTNTVVALTGGANALSGTGMDYRFTLAPLVAGSEVTITLIDNLTGLKTQVGFGNVTGIIPTYLTVFNNKAYALAGATTYFSAIALPEVWNDPNAAGNGFITMNNWFSSPEPVVACCPYQGSLVFIARRTCQVWHTDPDPANYSCIQTLPNMGTVAPLSVQPVGDMDVYMLADNGVRSVRVRDASNNAIIADVGTPIDALLQPLLSSLTDAQKATACGIVDPSANRYWVYVPSADGSPGFIYTFSYFPSAQIAAWGTYAPTYQVAVTAPATNYGSNPATLTYTGLTVGKRYAWLPGANEVSITCGAVTITKSAATPEGAFVATATTAVVKGTANAAAFTGALSVTTYFIPTKFVVFNGQIWARAGDALYQLGGPTNQATDNCGVAWALPFIDGGTPGTRKQFSGVDAAFLGTWSIGACTDYTVNIYRNIYNNTASSFLYASIGWEAASTHYSFQGVENGSGPAVFSSILCHGKQANEK